MFSNFSNANLLQDSKRLSGEGKRKVMGLILYDGKCTREQIKPNKPQKFIFDPNEVKGNS